MRSYTAELTNPRRPAPKEPSSPAPIVVDARAVQPSPVLVTGRPAQPVPEAESSAAKRIHVVEHPLAQHALTALRNRHTGPRQFRQLSNQLLALLVFEAARALPSRQETVETESGGHIGPVLARPVILLTLARHGLGLAHNLAEMFPELSVGAISLARSADGQSVDARLHLANAPALADAHVFLFDPVVSGGGNAQAALHLIRRCGAAKVSLISLLFSLPGLSHLQSVFPDLHVWTAGIDTKLDPKRGPLPGLGNFAERLYG